MKVGGGAAAIVYNSRPVLGAILLPAIGLHAIGGRNYGVTDLNGQNLVNIFPPTGSNLNSSCVTSVTHLENKLHFELLNNLLTHVDFEMHNSNYWNIAAPWAIAEGLGMRVNGELNGLPGTQHLSITV